MFCGISWRVDCESAPLGLDMVVAFLLAIMAAGTRGILPLLRAGPCSNASPGNFLQEKRSDKKKNPQTLIPNPSTAACKVRQTLSQLARLSGRSQKLRSGLGVLFRVWV